MEVKQTRRDYIFMTIDDMVNGFLYYDRKDDEDLPLNSIEKAVKNKEITVEEMADHFRRVLTSSFIR